MSVLRGVVAFVVAIFAMPILLGIVNGLSGLPPATPPVVALLSLVGAAVAGVWAA
jgi:hypothetical protein